MVLTEEGEVFAWGVNGHGQGDFVDMVTNVPSHVRGNIMGRKAVAIACTYDSSFALLEDGQVSLI